MKKLLLAAVLFTALCTSCKKENCPVPIDLSDAVFKGNVTFRTNSFNNSILTFKKDGELIYYIDAQDYKGTWGKLSNSNTVYVVYYNGLSVWKGSGTLNADGTKIENGILTQVVPSSPGGSLGTGTFSVTKQ
jgi:nitrous oxide reductase accessory protein NosL